MSSPQAATKSVGCLQAPTPVIVSQQSTPRTLCLLRDSIGLTRTSHDQPIVDQLFPAEMLEFGEMRGKPLAAVLVLLSALQKAKRCRG